MHRVDLDFWGIPSRVSAPHEPDVERVARAFRTFVVDRAIEPYEVELTTRPASSGFFSSGGRPDVEKVIRTRSPGEAWQAYERYRVRPQRISPVPPFGSPPFRTRFALVHGASLRSPDGEGITLLGPSLAGKSTLALELLRRGWGMLSDDLVIIDPAVGHLRRFDRPIGIRERTLERMPWLAAGNGLDGSTVVPTALGHTVTAQAQDLFGDCVFDEVPLGRSYVLDGYTASEPVLRPAPRSWPDQVIISLPDTLRASLTDLLRPELLSFDIDRPDRAAALLEREVIA